MFKKIDDTKFFVVVDMPLYKTQCMKLMQLMPNYVESVDTDHYGSFIIEVEEGVEQNRELYEEIWESGLVLFDALHMCNDAFWDGYDVEEDLEYAVESYLTAHTDAGYDVTLQEAKEFFMDWDVNEAELDKILFMKKLAA